MTSRPSLPNHLRARLPLAVAALVAAAVVLLVWADYGDAGRFSTSLAEVLESEVGVDEGTVTLIDEEDPFAHAGVLFLGRVAVDLPADLYYVEARIGEGGTVLSTRNLRNLTRTSSADERALFDLGDGRYAFGAYVHGRYDAFTVIDTAGEREALTEGWPRRARIQNAITNFQESGRTAGFDRRRYELQSPSEGLSFSMDPAFEGTSIGTIVRGIAAGADNLDPTAGHGARLRVQLDGDQAVVLDPAVDTPVEGEALIRFEAPAKGMPGTLTWVVDSVRNLSFVGPEPIAWLEHRVFALKDALQRAYYSFAGEPDTEAEVAAELGLEPLTEEETRRRAELAVTDPELGWPPATLTPVVRRPARGEGEWVAVVDDPYVRSYPGAPPTFYSTFLQVDPDRPFTRVYVVVWDPRAVQLRVMTGTREPESATGATGSGMVPRDPETLSRVVAGFNGGFQSLHGEFGMMADGRVYLPPKPWAATVAVYQDGRVSMGSWTDPPEGVRHYREQWAVRQIPEGMVEYRQNLTSVIEDGRINPWRRWYWGAAPQGDDEQAYIDRSGICLTEEGFMAYFWGKSMGADELGEAMKATRCVRGLHLDMNQRHTAFEFYNVQRTEELTPLAAAPTRDFQFEVPVPRAREWTARGRLLATSMTPMRFPRYIRQDPRDFFYLTLRPLLPGPDVTYGEGTLSFASSGLPHAGWPYAFAMAEVEGEEGASDYVVRIDLSRAEPAPLRPTSSVEGEAEPLAYLTGMGRALQGPLSLSMEQQTVGRRFVISDRPGERRLLLAGDRMTPAHGAGLGVDGDGFLVYAEGPHAATLLEAATVGERIGLGEGQRLAFVVGDQTAGPDAYERDVNVLEALEFVANTRPASEVLFPDVEPRPYMHWGRMQDTRVRYFRGDGPPRFVAPDPEDEDANE